MISVDAPASRRGRWRAGTIDGVKTSPTRRRSAILLTVSCVVLVMVLGGLATDIGPWYLSLQQPIWAPPNWLFGPAWALIYAFTATGAVAAWEAPATAPWRRRLLLLFAVNGVLNVMWSALFFTCQRPDWALMQVPLLWLSILALVIHILPRSRRAAALLAPYLVWVAFAAALNAAVVRLNPVGS